MPASPNEHMPSPTTIIQLLSPILDTQQALRVNPAKTSEKWTATTKLATPKLSPASTRNIGSPIQPGA